MNLESETIAFGSFENGYEHLDFLPGFYRIVVAQKIVNAKYIDDGQTLLDVYIESIGSSFDKSGIIVKDAGLDVPIGFLEKPAQVAAKKRSLLNRLFKL